MVSYAWVGTYGSGFGSVNMTLSPGFTPESRDMAVNWILENNPGVSAVTILNVVPFDNPNKITGPSAAVKLSATREALTDLAKVLRDEGTVPATLAQVADALDTIAGEL